MLIGLAVFISTIIIGMYVGAPIAIKVYDLTIPSEVQALFMLMPFVYFFASIPLCFLSGFCFRYIAIKKNYRLNVAYTLLCIVLVPTVFYGIGVAHYYW